MTNEEFYAWLNDPENPEKIPPELLMTPKEETANRGTVRSTEFGFVYRVGE